MQEAIPVFSVCRERKPRRGVEWGKSVSREFGVGEGEVDETKSDLSGLQPCWLDLRSARTTSANGAIQGKRPILAGVEPRNFASACPDRVHCSLALQLAL